MTKVRTAATAGALLVLAACGGGSTSSTGSVPTTVDQRTANAAYAQALLGVRRAYEFHPGNDYGKAAEALNQIKPPPGFELRHKQLVDETLALAGRSSSGNGNAVATGAAEGTAEADLTNLAHEADPNSGY